ncbi:MAG: D-glycerate dehydrogenase [Planctomycetes bacterium]|nr:D-glycerate dehydrogenase [Planctomycetota bacterium]
MAFQVCVTRELPRPALDFLRSQVQSFRVNPEDRALTPSELAARIQGCDGVVCTLNDRIDASVLDAAPTVKVFANYAVGYNNIDVPEATRRKVAITNTPGVLTDATADLAWALLFAAARRVVEADAFMRRGRFKGWSPMLFLGSDITGRTLGIVGAGRIGTAVGLRAKAFRMRVLYASAARRSEALERETAAQRVALDELLRESDFISVHAPLTDRTFHLIGRPQIEQMKPGAILINTARGPIVDEDALVEALRSRRIAAAGLDVFEDEPAMKPGLADLPNVVVLPHIGSATIGTRTRMAMMAAENLLAVLRGHRPPNLVNPEILTA